MTYKTKKAIKVLIQEIGYEKIISDDFKHMVMVADMELSDMENAKDIKDDIVSYLEENQIDAISSKKIYNALNKKFDTASVKFTMTKYKNELWEFRKIEGTKMSFEFVYLGEGK